MCSQEVEHENMPGWVCSTLLVHSLQMLLIAVCTCRLYVHSLLQEHIIRPVSKHV
jgi:hypothetical protein